MALGGLVLGSLILYLKGMRIMMFQLSGFYCNGLGLVAAAAPRDAMLPGTASCVLLLSLSQLQTCHLISAFES